MRTENNTTVKSTENTSAPAKNEAVSGENTVQRDNGLISEELADQIEICDAFSPEYINKIKLELMAEISLRLPRTKNNDQDFFREAEELLQDVRSHAQEIQSEETDWTQPEMPNAQTKVKVTVISENAAPDPQTVPAEIQEEVPAEPQTVPDEVQEVIQPEAQTVPDEGQEEDRSEPQTVPDDIQEVIQPEPQDSLTEPESESDSAAESVKSGWPIETEEPPEKIPVPEIESPYEFDFVW